jgi:thioredoxin-dependent peroxiredoxin
MAIKEGSPPPSLSLPDASGRPVSLADLAGKHVVVYFYPRDDTPGCTKEACGFRDLWAKLKRRGVVVLGVSGDSGASHGKFAAKYKLPFTLLSDTDKSVMKAWGAYGEKLLYGRKAVGVIRSTVWIGPDGKVRKHWKKVARAADHPAHVLAQIEADDT